MRLNAINPMIRLNDPFTKKTLYKKDSETRRNIFASQQ